MINKYPSFWSHFCHLIFKPEFSNCYNNLCFIFNLTEQQILTCVRTHFHHLCLCLFYHECIKANTFILCDKHTAWVQWRSTASHECCGLPWCTAQFPGCTVSPCSTWRRESETSANVTHFEQSFPASVSFKRKWRLFAQESDSIKAKFSREFLSE